MVNRLCGIIIVDKPEGITSQGVVGVLRRNLGMKRIGHGGTLDPMATGVLPTFVGRATRAAGYLLDAQKSYRAWFRCGFCTDTRDTTGNVVERTDIDATNEQVTAVLKRFVGVQQQIPPMYSALKVNGKKLYELARQGVEIERKPREIEIISLDYRGCLDGEHIIDVSCSKGTYIRELVHDIGVALGTFATMSSLRRTRTGGFSIEQAVALNQVSEGDILPVDIIFSQYPKLTVDEQCESRIRVGNTVAVDAPDGLTRVYSPDGGFLMLGEVRCGIVYTVKSFFEVD